MKFRNLLKSVAAVALVAVFAVSTQAATLSLQLVYEASYLSDFSPAAYTLQDGVAIVPGSVAPTDIHQFGVFAVLSGALGSPEESLGGLLADMVLGAGLTPEASSTYGGNTSLTFDPPPAGAGGGNVRNLFTTNEDSGAQDLLRIAAITDRLAAHGLDPGEAAAVSIGSAFINWDGVTTTQLALAPAAETSDPWSLWRGTDAAPTAQTAQSMSGSLPFHLVAPQEFVPEPSSLALAGLALIGLAGLRRRRS